MKVCRETLNTAKNLHPCPWHLQAEMSVTPPPPNAGRGTGRKMSGHLKQEPQRIKRETPHQSLLLIPENRPDAFGSWLCGSGCWLTIFSSAIEVHSSFFYKQLLVVLCAVFV